ncbi:response regulator-like transcription factor HsrA [Helicobacter pylori]|uniref:Putative transcriptional regulator n=1 Tax=Helicobacter pylori Shi169 TaxID=1163741 RepID=A0A0E0WA38_HELPX|nr:response regulator-like transcription factor HsrA [Helicobacter pylori]AFH99142.1 putative transcriptional regulator [Helicobacter pylori Shi169]QQW61449.1 response regulator-like transcription factor HsrA [Helicobacter pylori]QQW62899.1 response regulator-like transcription factor HsrA [Helicobacter pylori]QQW67282.1 response regulator-like transcription factor HsrA [Helicobacter pylori]QQW90519.1 response regulator-like transcription factor HsrA [Helicobacter pylori]
MRVLLIEKNSVLGGEIEKGLNAKGFMADVTESLEDGEYLMDIRNYDLVMVSDRNVLSFVSRIKEKHSSIVVLVSSDNPTSEEEIHAFEQGADDYIAKPYRSIKALVARIEARLRFWGSNVIEIGDLIISPDEEKIIYKGREVEVKGKPFEVLTHLARHRDQIVSKEQLLDAIWEEPEMVTPNVIEVAINQIRQKMDKPLGISTVETVRRRGYRFCYPKPACEE